MQSSKSSMVRVKSEKNSKILNLGCVNHQCGVSIMLFDALGQLWPQYEWE